MEEKAFVLGFQDAFKGTWSCQMGWITPLKPQGKKVATNSKPSWATEQNPVSEPTVASNNHNKVARL